MGDSSDNVPGVKGIGEKGAIELIARVRLGRGPARRASSAVTGKKREYIERDRELLLLSRELVTIDTRVPLDRGVAELGPAAARCAGAARALPRAWGSSACSKKLEAEPEPARASRDYRDRARRGRARGHGARAARPRAPSRSTPRPPASSRSRPSWSGSRSRRARAGPSTCRSTTTPPVVPGGTRGAARRAARRCSTDPGLVRVGQNCEVRRARARRPRPAPAAARLRHDGGALLRGRRDAAPRPRRARAGLLRDQEDPDPRADRARREADHDGPGARSRPWPSTPARTPTITWRLYEVLREELADTRRRAALPRARDAARAGAGGHGGARHPARHAPARGDRPRARGRDRTRRRRASASWPATPRST